MLISKGICIFTIYSLLGWVYETVVMTIYKGKWQNRGFLSGPICPIYGVGSVAIMAVAGYLEVGKGDYAVIFIVSVVGSAVLEYTTSWTLEKAFNAVWWDYTIAPFNLHGRISLFSSLGFGAAGIIVVYYIEPLVDNLVGSISPLTIELISTLSVFLLAIDLTLNVVTLSNFSSIVKSKEDSFNRSIENAVDNTMHKVSKMKDDIVSKQRLLVLRIGLIGGIGKSAIMRVVKFRYSGADKDNYRLIMGLIWRKQSDKDLVRDKVSVSINKPTVETNSTNSSGESNESEEIDDGVYGW